MRGSDFAQILQVGTQDTHPSGNKGGNRSLDLSGQVDSALENDSRPQADRKSVSTLLALFSVSRQKITTLDLYPRRFFDISIFKIIIVQWPVGNA